MTAQDSVLNTLAHLVSIPSINPNYINGTGESKLGEWIYEFFRQSNIHVEKQSVLPGRFNVIAKIPGKESAHRVVYEAHMDTVSDHGMSIDPYTPVIKEGFLYGRGACDTKGGLAAMIHAVREIAQRPRDSNSPRSGLPRRLTKNTPTEALQHFVNAMQSLTLRSLQSRPNYKLSRRAKACFGSKSSQREHRRTQQNRTSVTMQFCKCCPSSMQFKLTR